MAKAIKTLKGIKFEDVIEAATRLSRGFQGLSQTLKELEDALTQTNFSREKDSSRAREMGQAQTYWLCKVADDFFKGQENNISCKYIPFNDFNDYSGPISGFYKEARRYAPNEHIDAAKEAGLRVVSGIGEE